MRRQKGFTLLEVVISMLLTSIIVSTIFSIALSTRRGGGKADRHLIANEASRRLTALLKAFVTADPTTALVTGPNTGANPWSLTGPATGITDDCGGGPANCYALKTGSHTLTGFLPDWFASTPYNATVTYFVAYPQAWTVANGTVPVVNVTVTWADQ